MTRLARLAVCSGAVAVIAVAAALASTGGISTVAGNGVAGLAGDGGPAGSARLNLPRSVAAMPGGGFLIADRENNRVRRVWPNGTITTAAGSGPIGAANGSFAGDGGPATGARLDFIHDATPMPGGGFLVSDTRNQRVRFVSPAGVISTVAGSGPFGCFCDGGFSGDGGQATAARLNNPHGLAVNPDGSYLVADTDNHRIRRVATNGTITTIAGSGPIGSGNGGFGGEGGAATGARLNRPFAVDPIAGGFLIADTGNHVIRRVRPDGTIVTVAGRPGQQGFSGDGGLATGARLSGPHAAVSMPDGGFLIADKNNHRIRRVWPDGTITTVAGSGPVGDASGAYGGDGGPATGARLNRPKDLAVATGGYLIADESNHRIRFVSLFTAAPPVELALTIRKARLRVRRGARLRLRYTSTLAARIRLELRRRGRVARSLRRRARPGRNTIILGGKVTRRLAHSRYRVLITAESADGQRARDYARLRVVARRRP